MEQARVYNSKNSEKISKRKKEKYAKDPKKQNAKTLAYYFENKDKVREARRAYLQENSEAIRKKSRDAYAANPEKFRSIQKLNRLKEPEKYREKSRLYKLANPEIVAAGNRKRKAMKKGATGAHTAIDVQKIFDGQRGLCANCRKKLFKSGAKKFHVDHVMPLAKGGSNDKYNLQLLCPWCNLSKHSKDPIDWAQENGRLL